MMRHFWFYLALAMSTFGCSNPAGETTSAERAENGDNSQPGVVMLRYTPGSESTEQREQGFLETLQSEFPDIQVISSNQYSGTTPESSLAKSQQILLKYGDNVRGVFAVCEPNAYGMLRALEEANMTAKAAFIGFDPNDTMVAALEQKMMQGIVLQDPVQMGYLAVKTMVAHLEGQPVEPRIPTNVFVATPENMHSEEMQRLLKPPQFSGEPHQPSNLKYHIAVVPKGTTHEFWKSIHEGVERAARELDNVQITWKGPLQENDREGQINVMQDFITKRVDGICLAPLDSQALVNAVEEAKAAGIPTVIFDSDLADDGKLKVSYVATDNYDGGAIAARRMGELLSQ